MIGESLSIQKTLLLTACLLVSIAANAVPSPPSFLGFRSPYLVCEYYKLNLDPAKEDFGTSDVVEVYAKDSSHKLVTLAGHLEDGFFVAKRTRKASVEDCESAFIAKIKKRTGFKLLSMRADLPFFMNPYGVARRLLGILIPKHRGFPIAFEDSTTRAVVFGDSLSDDGNIKSRTFGYYPKSPYFHGRFSNGPVWTDYLAANGQVPLLNWSLGGGRLSIKKHEPIAFEHLPQFLSDHLYRGKEYLESKVTGFLDDYVNGYLRSLPTGRIVEPKKTVFLFWLGSNDSMSTWGRISEEMFAAYEKAIVKLSNAGAREFVVMSLLNCELSPMKNWVFCSRDEIYGEYIDGKFKRKEGGFHKFNELLGEFVEKLTKRGIRVQTIDMFKAHNSLIQGKSPATFELSSPTFDYGFRGKYDEKCFTRDWSSGSSYPKSDTCPNLNRTFSYDSAHPTSYAHCWLSLFVHEGLYQAGFIKEKPDLAKFAAECKD